MEEQIITEQIDIVVVGDRKLQLVSLMLDKEIMQQSAKRKLPHQKYLDVLGRLIGNSIVPESQKSIVNRGYPKKFTKVILTDSFWLHIHFFVHDNKIFDPFISQSCRGPVSICIIASSEGIDLNSAKNYLHQSNVTRPLEIAREGGIVRPEMIVEAQIFASAHQIGVAGFSAVLALKITQEKRIIEQSSNLRLTVNQISRWIVDRHFETKYRVKIKEQLGDEIEHYEQKPRKGYCALI